MVGFGGENPISSKGGVEQDMLDPFFDLAQSRLRKKKALIDGRRAERVRGGWEGMCPIIAS